MFSSSDAQRFYSHDRYNTSDTDVLTGNQGSGRTNVRTPLTISVVLLVM